MFRLLGMTLSSVALRRNSQAIDYAGIPCAPESPLRLKGPSAGPFAKGTAITSGRKVP